MSAIHLVWPRMSSSLHLPVHFVTKAVVISLWVVSPTAVSRTRSKERLKKLPWVSPETLIGAFYIGDKNCGFDTKLKKNKIIPIGPHLKGQPEGPTFMGSISIMLLVMMLIT